MHKSMTIVRIGWIDALRAMLIVLVVAGHVFGMVSHYVPTADRSFYDLLFKIIYSFHMPAFFMLAGLMTSDSLQAMPVAFQVKKLFKRLLVPYFFWGFVGAAVYTFAMPYFGNASVDSTGYYARFTGYDWWHPYASLLYGAAFPGTDGFRCNSVLWFLPCLFSVKLVGILFLRLISPSSRSAYSTILLIIIIGLLGWASRFLKIPPLPYGLSKLLWYFPFFLIGYRLRLVVFDSAASGLFAKLLFRRIACCLILAVFAILVWRLPNDTVYFSIYLMWYIVEVVLGVLGAVLCMGVAMSMPICCSRVSLSISMNSIGIMFLHKYIVLAIMLIPTIKSLLFQSLSVGIMISVLVIIVSTAAACVISACARRFVPWTIGVF